MNGYGRHGSECEGKYAIECLSCGEKIEAAILEELREAGALREEAEEKLSASEKEADARKTEVRSYQIMIRRTIDHIPTDYFKDLLADGCSRASGEAECRICKLPFMRHPQIPGMPTFHIVCTGEIFKT